MPTGSADTKTESKTRILSTSGDPRLGSLRADVLRTAGYDVTFPSSHAEVLAAIDQGYFDVLIIGHSIHVPQAKHYAEAFRVRNPNGKVLLVYQSALVSVRADGAIRAIDGPEALISAVEALCGRDRRGSPERKA